MPIFTAQEIKVIDAHTILHEPITSIDLMERAAIKCTDWILKHYVSTQSFKVFCGLGNNGGDGLAIARLLIHNGFTVDVYIINYSKQSSPDFLNNKNQLEALKLTRTKIFQTSIQRMLSLMPFLGLVYQNPFLIYLPQL
jgi:NAD(P)H-hydrate epimerase